MRKSKKTFAEWLNSLDPRKGRVFILPRNMELPCCATITRKNKEKIVLEPNGWCHRGCQIAGVKTTTSEERYQSAGGTSGTY